MLKQFYEKALPVMEGGMYCIGAADSTMRDPDAPHKPSPYAWKHHWVESLEEAYDKVEQLKKAEKYNIYVAMGIFPGPKRDAETCAFLKTVFLDIDVGPAAVKAKMGYATKEEAIAALDRLIQEAELPEPFRVDSGVGIHAYWVFDTQIPKHEFIPYAKLFRDLCRKHIDFDPNANSTDAARCMRWIDSVNYSAETPQHTKVLSDELHIYSFDEFKEFLGEPPFDVKEILASAHKGLDEETKKFLKNDNFERSFEQLAAKSLDDVGCNQIKNIIINARDLVEPLWWAGLSIARFCDDGDTAIHKLSEDYDGYSHEETKQKAERLDAPRTCQWFLENYPDHCDGCQHRGKINSPISLARVFKVAPPSNETDPIRTDADSQGIQGFPNALFPFMRGEKGGIYYQPPPKIDKKGKKLDQDVEMIFPYDFYPIRRIYSPHDGECLMMHVDLPRDARRSFLLPMRSVYAQETFRSLLTSNGVLFSHHNSQSIMNYVIKWGQYMQTSGQAEVMRMQMGWTENIFDDSWVDRSFVIGTREIKKTGEVTDAPTSPFVKGVSRLLHPRGTYEKWQQSAQELNAPGFELHALAMLAGFGSPLMCYTSTSGVTISFTGKSGVAKTGALYGALSIWGNPKELSVCETTENGFTGRYLSLRNLPFGLDEASNREGKWISDMIHKVSHGKTKIRMQASVNAEREYEMAGSMIAIITTNQPLYAKLESYKVNPDGEAARLMEFMLAKPEALEIGGGSIGRMIFDPFNFNYGHAGPKFVQALMQYTDNAIRDMINRWLARFAADFGHDSAYRFHANGVASMFTAGEVANNAGIINYDLERIYKSTIRELINIRDTVIEVNRTDYSALLGEYINKNLNSILVLHDKRVKVEPRNQIVARISVDENLLQVSKTEFKKYLQDRNISSREFEEDMRQRGYLTEVKKGRLTTGWNGGFGTDPVYLYIFKTQIPEEWKNGPAADAGA